MSVKKQTKQINQSLDDKVDQIKSVPFNKRNYFINTREFFDVLITGSEGYYVNEILNKIKDKHTFSRSTQFEMGNLTAIAYFKDGSFFISLKGLLNPSRNDSTKIDIFSENVDYFIEYNSSGVIKELFPRIGNSTKNNNYLGQSDSLKFDNLT